jgi:hypothetical protein
VRPVAVDLRHRLPHLTATTTRIRAESRCRPRVTPILATIVAVVETGVTRELRPASRRRDQGLNCQSTGASLCECRVRATRISAPATASTASDCLVALPSSSPSPLSIRSASGATPRSALTEALGHRSLVGSRVSLSLDAASGANRSRCCVRSGPAIALHSVFIACAEVGMHRGAGALIPPLTSPRPPVATSDRRATLIDASGAGALPQIQASSGNGRRSCSTGMDTGVI